jgi:hypothetical protein
VTDLTHIAAVFDSQADARAVAGLVFEHVCEHRLPGLWHPYGFIVFQLGEDEVGNRLRLHLWPDWERTKQTPEWPIHNHPWSFTSVVLYGSVVQHRYSVTVDRNGTGVLFKVSYQEGLSRLTRTTMPVLASCIGSETLVHGRSYHLSPSEYHSVHVGDGELAATLVRSEKLSTGVAYVLGQPDGKEVYEFARKPVELANALELLHRLSTIVADAEPGAAADPARTFVSGTS